MQSIDDIIAGARLPEKTVPLCLRGDLQAQWEDLERELRAHQGTADEEALAGDQVARDLAERMEAIAQEMTDHQVVFRFRGLPKRAYSDLLAQHQAPEDKRELAVDGLDWDTFPTALIAACAVDPEMTVEQAGRLAQTVTDRQWDDLFATAMALNRAEVSVPFSLAASAIRAAGTALNSKQPEPGESPAPGFSAASLAG